MFAVSGGDVEVAGFEGGEAMLVGALEGGKEGVGDVVKKDDTETGF